MSRTQDRLDAVERRLMEIARQIAGMPIRIASGGTSVSLRVYLAVQTSEITAMDWSANPPELGFGTVQPFDLDPDYDHQEPNRRYLLCDENNMPAEEVWYNMAPAVIEYDEDAPLSLQAVDWQGIKLIDVETCDSVSVTCADIG